MPVLSLECQDCGHTFLSLVMAGTKPPETWVCSQCSSESVVQKPAPPAQAHPWDGSGTYRNACPCCGF